MLSRADKWKAVRHREITDEVRMKLGTTQCTLYHYFRLRVTAMESRTNHWSWASGVVLCSQRTWNGSGRWVLQVWVTAALLALAINNTNWLVNFGTLLWVSSANQTSRPSSVDAARNTWRSKQTAYSGCFSRITALADIAAGLWSTICRRWRCVFIILEDWGKQQAREMSHQWRFSRNDCWGFCVSQKFGIFISFSGTRIPSMYLQWTLSKQNKFY